MRTAPRDIGPVPEKPPNGKHHNILQPFGVYFQEPLFFAVGRPLVLVRYLLFHRNHLGMVLIRTYRRKRGIAGTQLRATGTDILETIDTTTHGTITRLVTGKHITKVIKRQHAGGLSG